MSYQDGNGADGKHYWLTPPDIKAQLQAEFGFDFDPCPFPRPDGFDGLICEWGASSYVNPPFNGPTAWVKKAIREYRQGKRVVFVFPIDKWVHMLLQERAEVRNLAMREFGRVLEPGGYLAMLHTYYPSYRRKEWRLEGLIAIVTGFQRATRVLSIFRRLPPPCQQVLL